MVSPAHTAKPSVLAVFRNRNFTLLWLAILVSEFGTGITSIAASILVFRETGSALSVGFMLMATALPGLLFGLIAGVFVDRMDRKRVLVITEILSGIIIFLIPVMLPLSIWWLYILVALKSTAYQFFSPAHNSLLPEVTTDEELAAANALLSTSHFAATGLGFAAAGLIASTFTPEWAFIVDALTFFVSAMLIAFVASPGFQTAASSSVESVVSNLRDGAAFLWHSPVLRSMLLLTIPMGVIYGFWNSAMLPFASRALGATEFEYSLIEGISLVGFVLGSITMTVVADRLREGQWVAISFVGMGVFAAIFARLDSVTAAIVVSVIFSYLNVPSYIGRTLIIQRNTTREIRGRVSSVFFVTRDFSFVIGMALVGIIDAVDVRDALLVAAVLLSALGIATVLMPGLRRSASEWRRSMALLRGISEAPGLNTGRSATLADIDRLIPLLPVIGDLSLEERQRIMAYMSYTEAAPGTAIVHQGEVNDYAYFVLDGRVIVGHIEESGERVLAVLSGGDFFGEIAALTGAPRTANVVAEVETHLLRVTATALREMTRNPSVNRLFYSKMMSRMISLQMIDLPRRPGANQDVLRQLRTVTHEIPVVTAM